ncbi:MAG: 23S rRNA (pseudouridine(1915)-N(3))-methyltransferase RlmH [Bacilli bacterium]|nr:23S rRNA (pseudouridine(1915)-N(3))-methyltransferase RlmH [Bacilli bacterium]
MIKIICVGKIKEEYLNNLINDYKYRISKYHKIEIIEIKDSNIINESKEINNILNEKEYNICLDIKGEMLSSTDLSHLIEQKFTQAYKAITFIIGGSDGIADEIKNKCNKKISFSHLTFPHGLFRGILLEQIYRSFKILSNETYHK